MEWLHRQFGTWRGSIRLSLSYVELMTGVSGRTRLDKNAVSRVVFVCHGNICRSAFADVVAQGMGISATSFGLAAGSGGPAHEVACEVGQRLGYDLSRHRTQPATAYRSQPGDLLLAMETQQLRRIAQDSALNGVPRSLLGLWASPPVPHIHDPYGLGGAYFETCLRRIEQAVKALPLTFPSVLLSQQSCAGQPTSRT